jgi:sulfur-carrier protein
VARVTLTTGLIQFTGGVRTLDIDATSVQRLFATLSERFPALSPHLDSGVAVAIDGQIYQDALFQPIGANSEVHILPMIAGG